jgi:putative transposase
MPRPFRRSSTISSSAGSTRRCRGSSFRRREGAVQGDPPNLRTRRGVQRCQIHKARNVMERLPKSLHASVRRVLRQVWELDDADKAEKLLRNLAQRLERDWSGVSGSILEGIDEILTVTRLGLPKELRRSLACTNMIENVMGTVRRVCRNVKRWRSAWMAMRWTAAAMQEAAKGFRRLKAHKQLPMLRAALEAHQNKNSHGVLARQANAA